MMTANQLQDPEAGHRHIYPDEKSSEQLSAAIIPTVPFSQSSAPPRQRMMPQLRSCLMALVIAALLSFAYASVIHQAPPRADLQPAEKQADRPQFERLLSQVSDKSLHDVLHKYVTFKYKHGVFPEDRKAVQAIHDENPAVGTSLVELARRQNSNSTTTPPPPTSDTTSVQLTTTQQPGTTTQQTTSQAPTTTAPPATTSGNGETTSKESSNGETTTAGNTQNTETTTPEITSRASKTQEVIYTTTLPGGARSTVTYITIVPADQSVTTPGVAPTDAPSLQNACDGRDSGALAAGIGAGIMGLMMAM